MSDGWQSLPTELRWMIRDHIRNLKHQESATTSNPSQYWQTPLVCREWHGWFVHDNFRRLVLDQERLDSFERLVSSQESRRDHVERLVLRVKVSGYGYPADDFDEDEQSPDADLIFSDTLRRFMAIVSTWMRSENTSGITLDLETVYSPNHRRYSLPGHRSPNQHDGQVAPRAFAPASIISSLVLKRQDYCRVSFTTLIRLIRQGLPNMTRFRHEMCVRPGRADDTRFQAEYTALLDALPSKVHDLSLLCESRTSNSSERTSPPRYALAGPDLCRIVVNLAKRLGSFSSSNPISAECFVAGAMLEGLPFYPLLEHLVLTSAYLQGRIHCLESAFVMLIAGSGYTAFISMPKLKSLVLWDGNMNDGFLMRFSYTAEREPVIHWRSTWHSMVHLAPAFAILRRTLGGSRNLKTVRVRPRTGKDDTRDLDEAPELWDFEWTPACLAGPHVIMKTRGNSEGRAL